MLGGAAMGLFSGSGLGRRVLTPGLSTRVSLLHMGLNRLEVDVHGSGQSLNIPAMQFERGNVAAEMHGARGDFWRPPKVDHAYHIQVHHRVALGKI